MGFKRVRLLRGQFHIQSHQIGLTLGGFCIGLIIAEVALLVLGQPRVYKAHTSPPQFKFFPSPVDGTTVYVNLPSSRIRFVYDGNPRGYFGPENAIDHVTNETGFRGVSFLDCKPENTFRLIFLGDSFTFGEGVHFEHTYPEVTATTLRNESNDASQQFESYNLGVGGYNTAQSLQLLKMYGLSIWPDVVVLGYVLNDAEGPLFEVNPTTGLPIRREREKHIAEGLDDHRAPDSVFRLRTVELVNRYFYNRKRTNQTVMHYRSLYQESNCGWRESRRSLREIISTCQSNDIPCCVLLFPVLHELTDDYPFRDIHARIAAEVGRTGAVLIDVFPKLKGMNAEDLWVHPTDQHPNEKVHAIASQALVEILLRHNIVAQ